MPEPNKISPPQSDWAPPSLTAPPQPSYAHTLFIGPDGLRWGWGFAFYIAGYYVLQMLAVDLTGKLDLGTLRSSALDEFAALLAALIPAFLLARVERRPWADYGLPPRRAFGKLFWIGSLWGFAGISLLIVLLYSFHAFSYGHLHIHGFRIARFAFFWGVMFLFVGFFEEFLLRGYTQFTLARGIGFWPAAILLSSAFGMIHLFNAGESWPGVLAAAAIGFFFCLTLRRTGNLWFAVGFHAAWDWGESFFYSVPDSGMLSPGHLLTSSFHGPVWLTGGTVGPEGSVLCFVVIAIVWTAFAQVYKGALSLGVAT